MRRCGGNRARTLVIDPLRGLAEQVGTIPEGAKPEIATGGRALVGAMTAEQSPHCSGGMVMVDDKSKWIGGHMATDPASPALRLVEGEVVLRTYAIPGLERPKAAVVLAAKTPGVGLGGAAGYGAYAYDVGEIATDKRVITQPDVSPLLGIVVAAKAAGSGKSFAILNGAARSRWTASKAADPELPREEIERSGQTVLLVTGATQGTRLKRSVLLAGTTSDYARRDPSRRSFRIHVSVYRRIRGGRNSFCSARTAGVRAGQVFHGGDQTPCR